MADFRPDGHGWPGAPPPVPRTRGWRSNPLIQQVAFELDRRAAPAAGTVRIDPYGPEGARRFLTALIHADEVWFPNGVDVCADVASSLRA